MERDSDMKVRIKDPENDSAEPLSPSKRKLSRKMVTMMAYLHDDGKYCPRTINEHCPEHEDGDMKLAEIMGNVNGFGGQPMDLNSIPGFPGVGGMVGVGIPGLSGGLGGMSAMNFAPGTTEIGGMMGGGLNLPGLGGDMSFAGTDMGMAGISMAGLGGDLAAGLGGDLGLGMGMGRALGVEGMDMGMVVAMAVAVLASTAVGVMLALWNSMDMRRRQVAILRVLGASRGRVLSLVLAESVVMGLVGALFGLILAWLGGFIAAGALEARDGGEPPSLLVTDETHLAHPDPLVHPPVREDQLVDPVLQQGLGSGWGFTRIRPSRKNGSG